MHQVRGSTTLNSSQRNLDSNLDMMSQIGALDGKKINPARDSRMMSNRTSVMMMMNHTSNRASAMMGNRSSVAAIFNTNNLQHNAMRMRLTKVEQLLDESLKTLNVQEKQYQS